ncbi:MAG TPA: recombinase family protein, partial [Symbiobacteriaceae bacterium]|nr:recombinase family protein [Symbiobacteriaceae bacterium]
VIDRFRRLGVVVWSVTEGLLALDTQMDKFIRFLEGWQAETESRNTSLRVSTAMRQMARQGRWSGGRPPYGFALAPGRRPRSEAPALVIDPEQARVIGLMADLYLGERMGGVQIARELNRRAIPNPGGRPWDDQKVRRILQNPIIAGLPAFDRSRPCGASVTRRNPYQLDQFILPRDEAGNLRPVAAYQIIPLERWLQLMAAMQSAKTPPRAGGATYTISDRLRSAGGLLTGLLFCGHCGARLSADTERGQRLTYVCQTKCHRGAEYCDGQRSYGGKRLEGLVLAQVERVLALLSPPGLEVSHAQADDLRIEVARAARTLEGWLTRMDAYLAAPAESPFTEELLTRKIREARERLQTVEARQRSAPPPAAPPATWWEAFRGAPLAVRKLALRDLLERIVVRRDEVELRFRAPLEAFR